MEAWASSGLALTALVVLVRLLAAAPVLVVACTAITELAVALADIATLTAARLPIISVQAVGAGPLGLCGPVTLGRSPQPTPKTCNKGF